MDESPIQAEASSPGSGPAGCPLDPLHRSSRRVTITLPFSVYCRLLDRADQQGRSTSNLVAFYVERALALQREHRVGFETDH